VQRGPFGTIAAGCRYLWVCLPFCLPSLAVLHCLAQAAGSADAFKKVDLDYVAATARAAKAAAVPAFALVSAQGAKAGVWASDFKIFHGDAGKGKHGCRHLQVSLCTL
jgi:hypothetical protein